MRPEKPYKPYVTEGICRLCLQRKADCLWVKFICVCRDCRIIIGLAEKDIPTEKRGEETK